MLKIKNLHSGYGEFDVLKGVDIEVMERQVVALIGPNGAGKSTVIKSVFGIAQVRSGGIEFEGENILDLETHELISIGMSYVPQGRIVFGNLTVKENLEMGAETLRDRRLIEHRINEVYEKFPVLKKKAKKLGFTLSGGERQMLALGRALITKPSIMMLDEPSLGLSPKLQKELFRIISKLKDEGISVLIVEQNAKKAIEIADKTYLLEDGKVVLEGGKEILRNKKIGAVYLGGRY
jgi:branched-chain amino acid transport system ATP-binding protein